LLQDPQLYIILFPSASSYHTYFIPRLSLHCIHIPFTSSASTSTAVHHHTVPLITPSSITSRTFLVPALAFLFFFRFSVFFCPFHPIRTAGSCLSITDHKSPVPCFSPGIISYWGREDLLKKKVYIFNAINPPSPSPERLPQQPTPRAGESSRASTPRKITTPLPTFIYRADSPSSCWLESLL